MKKRGALLFLLLFAAGCAQIDPAVHRLLPVPNVQGGIHVAVSDNRSEAKTPGGASRVLALLQGSQSGGLYSCQLDRPLDDHVLSALARQIQSGNGGQFSSIRQIRVTITSADMRIVAGTPRSEVSGSMESSVEVTDAAGGKRVLQVSSTTRGESSAATPQAVMRSLFFMMLGDFAGKTAAAVAEQPS